MKFQTALVALTSTGLIAVQANTIYTQQAGAAEMVATLLANQADIVASNPTFKGNPSCAALFFNGRASVPNGPAGDLNFPDEGILISTGKPVSMNVQDGDKESTSMGVEGDADLTNLVGGYTYDACVLEFDFDCMKEDCAIAFDYVFGSDEYNTMVDRKFNDAFAWFLNKKNIAIIPGTTNEYVSIDTINKGKHSDLYVNNDMLDTTLAKIPFPNFQADGFTKVLTAKGVANGMKDGVPGKNHMKLVIADRGDSAYDS